MFKKFVDYLTFEKRFSKHTIIAYTKDVESFIGFIKNEYQIEIDSIDRKHIKAWIVKLVKDEISNKTINRNISSLRRFFTFLMLNDKIEGNPCQHIKALKQKRRLPEVFQESELFCFKDVCLLDGKNFVALRDYCILEVLYQTGIRRGELIEIRKEDVDVIEGSIKIFGKGGKERIVPISKHLLNIIQDYCVYREELVIGTDFLFLTSKGKKLYPKAVYNIVKKYLSLLSTKKNKSPHILRHSFATHMLEYGADLNAVKDILGHASLSATQIYTHNTISKLREAYKDAHPKGER